MEKSQSLASLFTQIYSSNDQIKNLLANVGLPSTMVDASTGVFNAWTLAIDVADNCRLLHKLVSDVKAEVPSLASEFEIAYQDYIGLKYSNSQIPSQTNTSNNARNQQSVSFGNITSGRDTDVTIVRNSLTDCYTPETAPANDKSTKRTYKESAALKTTKTDFRKDITIFIASSSELASDRDGFELFFRTENDNLIKQGLYLRIVRWENFLDSISETRLQDEYNRKIVECDIVVCLFKTKTGRYTEEEFDVAHSSFKSKGKPQIFTFFKDSEISIATANRDDLNSMWAFQEKLQNLGHFWTTYKNIDDLKLRFKLQIEKLRETGSI